MATDHYTPPSMFYMLVGAAGLIFSFILAIFMSLGATTMSASIPTALVVIAGIGLSLAFIYTGAQVAGEERGRR